MTDLKISTRLTALLGGLCVLVLLIGIGYAPQASHGSQNRTSPAQGKAGSG